MTRSGPPFEATPAAPRQGASATTPPASRAGRSAASTSDASGVARRGPSPGPLLLRSEQGRLAIAGALLALAFPPLPLGVLSLVALTPVLSVLDEDPLPGFRRGFLRGGFFGSIFYLILLFWLWNLVRFTPLIVPTWLLSCLYLGALVGLATGAAEWLRARTGRSTALLLPFTWLALEKLLQYGDLRFTWGVLADTLTPTPVLLQTAELWGAPGLSFLIVSANGLVYTLWRRRADPAHRRAPAAVLALLAVAVPVYGFVRWGAYAGTAARVDAAAAARAGAAPAATVGAGVPASTPTPPTTPVAPPGADLAAPAPAAPPAGALRIAVIQPNIPQEARDDPRRADLEKARLFELSRRALALDPDLVAWPETATPWLRYDPGYLEDLTGLCCGREDAAGTPFLVGGLDALDAGGPEQRIFNAAFLVSGTGDLAGVYRKVLLVPMTEQVPYSGLLRFLKPERWSGSFSAGEDFLPLPLDLRREAGAVRPRGPAMTGQATVAAGGAGQADRVQIGVPICYEIIFPQAIRDFRRRGARLIVTITNDAWFGRTPAPYQHFSQLKLRAVENRVVIARSANTGISGFVDARGDVVVETDIFETGLLVGDLALAGPPTPYTRWGDWIVPAAWMGLALTLLGGRRRRDRARGSRHGGIPEHPHRVAAAAPLDPTHGQRR